MVRKQFETNVFGLLEVCKKVIQVMKKQRSGKIVNVSSVVGHFAGLYGGVYSATKHSIEALSTAMRMELREHGTSVIVVNPGLTHTGFHAVANDLLGRLGPSGYSEWYRSYMARHRGGASPAIAAKTIASEGADPAPKCRYVIGKKRGPCCCSKRFFRRGRSIRWSKKEPEDSHKYLFGLERRSRRKERQVTLGGRWTLPVTKG